MLRQEKEQLENVLGFKATEVRKTLHLEASRYVRSLTYICLELRMNCAETTLNKRSKTSNFKTRSAPSSKRKPNFSRT